MSNWPALEHIEEKLSSKVAKYFPDVVGGAATFQLKGVYRRTYSTLCFFSMSVDTKCNIKPRGVAVKCYRSDGGGIDLARVQHLSLLSIWPVFSNDGALSIPRPLDFFDEIPALVMEEVEGEPLQRMFGNFYVSGKRRAALTKACYKSGEWLRRFHHATREKSGALDVEAKLGQAATSIRMLAGHGFSGTLCRQLEMALVSRSKKLVGTEMERALVHGDFSTDNVLVGSDKIIVLDLHGKDRNAIYHDLASFLNSLELVKLRSPVLLGGCVDLCAKSFLEGYFDKTRYSADALLYLRLTGCVSAALEIVSRRGDQASTRFWIRPRLESLLKRLLNEAALANNAFITDESCREESA